MRAQFLAALVGMAGVASAAPQAAAGSSTTASGTTLATSTTRASSSTAASSGASSASSGSSTASSGAAAASGAAGLISKIDNKVLILARDADGASSASAGLTAYGIPFESVLIPQAGGALPTLNTSGTEGKYSGIIVIDALAYQYADGWRSAVTTDQWNTIWAYQASFKVRMVRINEYPGPSFGVGLAGAGGCCDTGVEQLISFTNTSLFPTANLKA